MAKKTDLRNIVLDTGVDEIMINGQHVLRINPSDLNLAARFEKMVEEIVPLTQTINEAEGSSEQIKVAYEIDQQIKEQLGQVFPLGNDFEAIFDGVNVMSITSTGATVLENFIEAITPVIEEYSGQRVETMRERAKQAAGNRATRRAAEKQV